MHRKINKVACEIEQKNASSNFCPTTDILFFTDFRWGSGIYVSDIGRPIELGLREYFVEKLEKFKSLPLKGFAVIQNHNVQAIVFVFSESSKVCRFNQYFPLNELERKMKHFEKFLEDSHEGISL
jgi:hypothetical protein